MTTSLIIIKAPPPLHMGGLEGLSYYDYITDYHQGSPTITHRED